MGRSRKYELRALAQSTREQIREEGADSPTAHKIEDEIKARGGDQRSKNRL